MCKCGRVGSAKKKKKKENGMRKRGDQFEGDEENEGDCVPALPLFKVD